VTATGTNPGNSALNQDRCMGLAYSTDTQRITVLFQAKMKELRYFNEGDFYDTILMVIDNSGDVE